MILATAHSASSVTLRKIGATGHMLKVITSCKLSIAFRDELGAIIGYNNFGNTVSCEYALCMIDDFTGRLSIKSGYLNVAGKVIDNEQVCVLVPLK